MSVAARFAGARRAVWGWLGPLAVVGMLALTPTGVELARAADPAPLAAEAAGPMSVDPALVARREVVQAPVCRASTLGRESLRQEALVRAKMLRLQQEIARRAHSSRSPAEGVQNDIVLNGRGYGYGRAQPPVAVR